MTNFEKVIEFHKKFGTYSSSSPSIPEEKHIALRKLLVREEFEELMEAIENNDLVGIADALCDLEYVVHGTALAYGIDTRVVFDEVHRTNMAKIPGLYQKSGKVAKPEGWQPPDIAAILDGMVLNLDGE